MKDLLIVGFGLAGLSAVHHAQELGLSFDVVNDNSQRSSKIAGGILNPVAIKRMKPVWNVEAFLPYATNYYQNIEEKYGINILTRRKIKVFIQDDYKSNIWFEALDSKRVTPFISSKILKSTDPNLNISNLGLVKAQQIDLSTLFSFIITHLEESGCYKDETFEYSSLTISENHVVYKGKPYRHILFCEGYGIVNNPFFNALDIYGNKGDYLIIEAEDLKTEQILKSKYFLIPLGLHRYKFGATYQRKPLDHRPSDIAKAEMLEALDKMINCPYKLLDQVCGIRPTTKDRKPVLGSHHSHKNLHVFNGFGSRGVMTSPLLGKQLMDYMINAVPLSNDISINRFYAQT